jgi:hypothetical protein
MAKAAHAARVAVPVRPRRRARRWRSLFGGQEARLGLAWRLAWGLAWPVSAAAAPSTPAFDDPAPHVSHDGSVQLAWPGPLGDYEVELRQPPHEPARVVYRGRMPSAHLSGLREGDYTVRVRAHDPDGASPWSEPKALSVRHHPLPLVYTLMALGLLTFAGTAAVVLRSSRRPA